MSDHGAAKPDASYFVTQTKTITVQANSAALARVKAELLMAETRSNKVITKIKIEKVRDYNARG